MFDFENPLFKYQGPIDELAYYLDQQHDFQLDQSQNYYYNLRGWEEKYWPGFFIRPNGDLYRLEDTLETSIRIARLDSSYWDDPSLLIDVADPSDNPPATCDSDERVVASLLRTSNSHISSGNDPNFPIKICCKVSPGPEIGSVFWADTRNDPTNFTNLNDLVKLIVSGVEFENRQINFTIFKNRRWWFDKNVAESSTKGSIIWRAGKNDVDETLLGGLYYFEVEIAGSEGIKSTKDNTNENFRFLKVSNVQITIPPVANITGPEDKQIYFIGEK
ncbi:hypothetical protein IID20_04820 [Patescibacteria group bacterium]|nr:hypothetical protein [Patescibacteria group bacterium]